MGRTPTEGGTPRCRAATSRAPAVEWLASCRPRGQMAELPSRATLVAPPSRPLPIRGVTGRRVLLRRALRGGVGRRERATLVTVFLQRVGEGLQKGLLLVLAVLVDLVLRQVRDRLVRHLGLLATWQSHHAQRR